MEKAYSNSSDIISYQRSLNATKSNRIKLSDSEKPQNNSMIEGTMTPVQKFSKLRKKNRSIHKSCDFGSYNQDKELVDKANKILVNLINQKLNDLKENKLSISDLYSPAEIDIVDEIQNNQQKVGDKNTKQNKYVPNFISKTNREDQPNSTSSLPIIFTDSKKKEVKNSVNMKLKDFNLQRRLVLK